MMHDSIILAYESMCNPHSKVCNLHSDSNGMLLVYIHKDDGHCCMVLSW